MSPETEAAHQNSAIIHFIICNWDFPDVTCQQVLVSILVFPCFPQNLRIGKKGGMFKWDTAIVFHFNRFDIQLKDVHLDPVLCATGNKY